jgi:4-carboxymuconolactone decarboxylase
MSIRDRRLLLIGLLVGQGLTDIAELQLDAAKRLDELGDEELREIVVFLTHYAGWPRGAALNQIVEKLIAKDGG